MRPVLLASLLLTACVPDLTVPAAAKLSCGTAADCPSGQACFEGLCVDPSAVVEAPSLDGPVTVAPELATRDVPVTIAFDVKNPDRANPVVHLALDGAAPVACTRASARFSCVFTPDGTELGTKQAGRLPFDVELTPTRTVRDAGTIHLDFEAPDVAAGSATLAFEPAFSPRSRRPVTALGPGATAVVRFVTTKLLHGDPVPDLPKISGDADAPAMQAVVTGTLVTLTLTAKGAGAGSFGPLAVHLADEAGNVTDAPVGIARVDVDGAALAAPEASKIRLIRVPYGDPTDASCANGCFRLAGDAGAAGAGALVVARDAADELDLGQGTAAADGSFSLSLRGDAVSARVFQANAAGTESALATVASGVWRASLGRKRAGSTVENPTTLVVAPIREPGLSQGAGAREANASELSQLASGGRVTVRAGSRWQERTAPDRLPDLRFAVSAFDAWRSRLVVFTEDNRTWEWAPATGRWVDRTPPSGPSHNGRVLGFAFDADRGLAVLLAAGGQFSTVWEWDGETGHWQQQPGADSPPLAAGATTWYDRARRRIVTYGGCFDCRAADGFSDGQMSWDGTRWTQDFPRVRPPPRGFAAAGVDPSTGNLILFGGLGPSGTLADTWEWDGTTWTERTASVRPPARAFAGFAFDGATGLLVGGASAAIVRAPNLAIPGAIDPDPARLLGDAWAWDPAAHAWSSGAAMPVAVARGELVASGEAGLTWLGGFDAKTLRTEAWTFARGTWTARPISTAVSPGFGAIAPDAAGGGALLLSGGGYSGEGIATWRVTGGGAAWTRIDLNPSETASAQLVFDRTHRRTWLVDGRGGVAGRLIEVWEWTGLAWKRVVTNGGVSARIAFGAAFDEKRETLVISGGTTADGVLAGDVYELPVATLTWVQHLASPSSIGGRCDTTPVEPLCAERAGPTLAWDGDRQQVVLAGGTAQAPYEAARSAVLAWNGTDFRRIAELVPPDASSDPKLTGLAWDAPRHRMIAISGYFPAIGAIATDGGVTWLPVPVSGPVFAESPRLGLESSGDLLVLGRGSGQGDAIIQEWRLRLSCGSGCPAWESLGTAPRAVGPRQAFAATVDEAGRFLLFGGVLQLLGGGTRTTLDTWRLDPATGWTELTPIPLAGGASVAAVPAADGVLVVGDDPAGSGAKFTWAFDGARWTRKASAGPGGYVGAYSAALAPDGTPYLHDGEKLWKFAGNAWSALPGGAEASIRKIAWDGARGLLGLGDASLLPDGLTPAGLGMFRWTGAAWTRPTRGIFADAFVLDSEGSRLVYDAGLDAPVLVGPRQTGGRMDAWAGDGCGGFRDRTPVGGELPTPRSGPLLWFDAEAQETVFSGGFHDGAFLHDTWSIDLGAKERAAVLWRVPWRPAGVRGDDDAPVVPTGITLSVAAEAFAVGCAGAKTPVPVRISVWDAVAGRWWSSAGEVSLERRTLALPAELVAKALVGSEAVLTVAIEPAAANGAREVELSVGAAVVDFAWSR